MKYIEVPFRAPIRRRTGSSMVTVPKVLIDSFKLQNNQGYDFTIKVPKDKKEEKVLA